MNACKALSVKIPWAPLIASGHKTIELRTWNTKYRGPLLICSTARPRKSRDGILVPALDVETAFAAPAGVTLCIVTLADVRPATALDAQAACVEPDIDRDFAWILEDRQYVPHVPFSGRLGLIDVDLEAIFGIRSARAITRSA